MDAGACERLLARLTAVEWDNPAGEERHSKSRGILALEYLRRTALWAKALDTPTGWPFFDLAAIFDPSVDSDPVWLERLESSVGRHLGMLTQRVVSNMFGWASLGDRPRERFPELDDPYEPMVQVFERGGEIYPGHGFIELYAQPVPYGDIVKRVAQPPFSIDPAALDDADERERVMVEEALARQAARRAERAAGQAQPPADA